MVMSTTSVAAGELSNEISEEQALDPHRAIVDPHHHLWEFSTEFWQSIYPGRRGPPRFLLPEFLATVERSGHNITQTVAVECHAMYRAAGPEELRPVGETEFVNGIAAMSASGSYGPCRVAAAIVGSANLRLGDRVRPVLESQVAAGNGRLRGIRTWTAYTEDGLLGMPAHPSMKGIMLDDTFRRGVSALEPLNLSLDIWCVHTQIPELTNLAEAFPQTPIIANHCGSPLNFGRFSNCEAEVFATWKKAVGELAHCPNVLVKVGGLGVDLAVPLGTHVGHASSETVSEKWRPYVETCISAFGSKRCMFESNFPPDNATCTYGAVWNAFKRIVSGCSEAEKTDLFSETAKKAYRLS
jgi:predicted TIM-barrel fold metal-dependent hydrolase